MTHDQINELLGAYALDAVDDEERQAIEDHLVTCTRCRAEVADHREVAALLAHGGSDAPEGVWDRIAGSLEAAPPKLDITSLAARRRRQWVPKAVLAAAAAVLVAVLGVHVRDQGRQIDQLQAAMADPMEPAFDRALDDPSSRLFQLTSADGRVVLRGAITDDGVGYLRASALPRLDDDRTYQLWGANGDQLVSLGVLGERPDIVTFTAADYDLLAITAETAGGVVQSRNAPVVSATNI